MIKKFKALIEKVNAKPVKEERLNVQSMKRLWNVRAEAFRNDALNYFTGVPAPAYLENDPWFGSAPNILKSNGLYRTARSDGETSSRIS